MSTEQYEAVFNYSASIARLDDDLELFRDMVQFYVEDTPGLLESLYAGLRSGDAAGVERAAHTIKGMSATFDGKRAMAAAVEVEFRAKDGQLADLEPVIDVLDHEVRRLAALLRDFQPPGE